MTLYTLGGKQYSIKGLIDNHKAVDGVSYDLLRKRLSGDNPMSLRDSLTTPRGYRPQQYHTHQLISVYYNTGRWTIKELAELFQIKPKHIYYILNRLDKNTTGEQR
jgi:hypothetical protein